MIHAKSPVLPTEVEETLWQVCHRRSFTQRDEIAFTYLGEDGEEDQHLTYGELDERARRIAAGLQQRGLVNEPVVLMFPTGLEYISAILGCMYAGAIAVPAYPIELMRARRTLARIELILASCRAKAVFSTPESMALLSGVLGSSLRGVQLLSWTELSETRIEDWTPGEPSLSDISLLQYTSGSTANPRGVMLTHDNILFQVKGIGFWDVPGASGVSWLPLFHDLGLFGGVLAPLYAGRRAIFMQPTSFVMRPMRWIEAMSRFRSTTSGAPTFGFELCASKVRPEDLDGIDLSNWRLALVGAETVRIDTLERFARIFEPCGFRMETFLPAYGLAEAGLGVAGGLIDQKPIVRSFSNSQFERNRAILADSSTEPRDVLRLVGSGKPIEGLDVRIVDPVSGSPLQGDSVGEIWVRGPGVAKGYWNDPEKTRLVFRNRLAGRGDYMRTGDLGFFLEGELFITGRLKELIIIGGRNIYPYDIEQTASGCDRLFRGQASAAFSIDKDGRERLVVAQELRRAEQADHEKLISAIRWTIQDKHQIPVDGVILLRPGAIPRTTSGKVQRSLCAVALKENRLELAAQWFSPALAPAQAPAVAAANGKHVDAQAVLAWLIESIAKTVGVPATEIQPHEPLNVYVVDSISIVSIAQKLQEWLGREFSPEILMQASSLADLARLLTDDAPVDLINGAKTHQLEIAKPCCEAKLEKESVPSKLTANGKHNIPADEKTVAESPLAGLSLHEKREMLKQLMQKKAAAEAAQHHSQSSQSLEAMRSPDGAVWAPVSRGQKALWFLHQASPTSPAYNFLYVAKIGGAVDVDALRKSLAKLAERHASLRTTFVVQEGNLRQKVSAKPTIDLKIQSRADLDDERLLETARTEADRPFDLANGPLFRAALIERRPDDFALFVVVHHIVADLWSMDAMLDELITHYAAERTGSRAQLPPLAASYLDYTKWQEDSVAGPRGERLWRQWSQRLEGVNQSLDLPTSKPRPANPSYRGETKAWILDDELTKSLHQLAKAESTTLFVTLLTAFEILLARYSGQREFLVGTASLGRHREEYENVVGYFLNQLPLRAKLSGAPTFRQLLARVRDEVLGALELEEYPFVELVDRLRPSRLENRHPLFQVMFVWNKPRGDSSAPSGRDNGPATNANAYELPLRRILMEQRGAPFELTLVVMELGDRLRTSLTYDQDLFDDAFIERMGGCLQTLLRAAVQDLETPALSLPLFDESEQRELVMMSQGQKCPYADSSTVHQLIERQVRRTPHALALEAPGVRLTYDQFNRQANRWARRLIKAGVRPGGRVGLLMDRSADAVTAILAIWKAGAAYVPLDPNLPDARLSFLVHDAGARLIVSTNSLKRRTPKSVETTLFVNESFGADELDADLAPIAGPEDIAYVIYTSGSTGAPKGVTAHHRGLCHLIAVCMHRCDVVPDDRVLLFSSLNFDASVQELLAALGWGATLVVGDEQELLVGETLAKTLVDRRVTMATIPPSVLATVPVEYAARLKDLRLLLSAGEPCSAELAFAWAPKREFLNAYGPTEATVWSTAARCEGDGSIPTIGRPNINTNVYILDDQLQLAPTWVPGELCIAGPGVTLGYLNRPEITADRFVPDPFAGPQTPPDSTLLYRTGDLARYRADGQIEYLGRLDRQLKIRGFRIEAGEVESALLSLSGVEQAAATGWRDSKGQQQLAAYVVAKRGVALTVADLRTGLASQLPAHLVPTRFVVLDAMPRLISGKIDFAALPSPDSSRPALDVDYTPPETPAQKALASIWREVVETDRIGIHDNFFELGGTSLDLVQILSKAREHGLELSIEMMLAHPTIAELSTVCAITPLSHEASTPVPPTIEVAAASSIRPKQEISHANMVFESIGVYLPAHSVTTDQIVAGCANPLAFPLEQMTGIRRRPMAEDEYSIDLARRAVSDCLSRSRVSPAEVDVLICCNISRCDGPDHRFSFEPSTAARLQREFGFSRAVCFDVSNACAGFFTALSFCETLMRSGAARRCLVASGEYITHLSQTAQREITGFLDPRVACLTLGDSGLAAMVEISDRKDEGFQSLDLMTVGQYADLCVAKVTEGAGGGAIMLTDAVQSTQVTIRQAVRHALTTLKAKEWSPDEVDYIIVHQTSSTTIKGVIRELNRAFARTICTSTNTIDNLAERGNMGPNSILVAMVDAVRRGEITAGSNVVFGISGSGQVIGTGLYRMGELPDRLNASATAAVAKNPAPKIQGPTVIRPAHRVRIASVAAGPKDAGASGDSLQLAVNAAKECLAQSAYEASDVGLLLHVGVYRNDFLSEPALAAMIARDGGFNASALVDDEHQTLACDLMSGSSGFLHGCFLASHAIVAKNLSTAMITASEIENNRTVRPDHLLGLLETGSATLLEKSIDNHEGFAAFGFLNIADEVSGRATFTQAYQDRPSLCIEQDEHWIDSCIAGVERAIVGFLEALDVKPTDLAAVLTSQPAPDFGLRLARRIGLEASQIVVLDLGGQDPFTSTIPLGLSRLRDEKPLAKGSMALFVEVGSGMQVVCALYQF